MISYRGEAHLFLRLLQEATDAVHAGVPKRVPFTFYVQRYGAINFLVNRDLQIFLFVMHVDMKKILPSRVYMGQIVTIRRLQRRHFES